MSHGGKRIGAGKKKGSKTKQTKAVKQCIINAFEDMGGVENLVKWGQANETEFYKLWGRMIPHDVDVTSDGKELQAVVILPSKDADRD